MASLTENLEDDILTESSFLNQIDSDINYFNNSNNDINSIPQSNYYTIDQLNDIFKSFNSQGIFILNYNIRSYHTNGENFLSMLQTLEIMPDVFILTETWFTSDSKNYAHIHGYKSYHSVRERKSGGVSIFFKDHLQVKVLDVFSQNNNTIESLAINVKFNSLELNIVGIYRPHSDTVENFTDCLNTIITFLHPGIPC